MTHRYPEKPLVGVGVVVYNENRQVILVKRGNDSSHGLWAIPSGAVALGEQVREAAVREVREECDIDIELKDLLGVVDLILKDNQGKVQYHYILLDYLAQYSGGNIKAQSDISEIGWFYQQELQQIDIPELTLKVLEKAFNSI